MGTRVGGNSSGQVVYPFFHASRSCPVRLRKRLEYCLLFWLVLVVVVVVVSSDVVDWKRAEDECEKGRIFLVGAKGAGVQNAWTIKVAPPRAIPARRNFILHLLSSRFSPGVIAGQQQAQTNSFHVVMITTDAVDRKKRKWRQAETQNIIEHIRKANAEMDFPGVFHSHTSYCVESWSSSAIDCKSRTSLEPEQARASKLLVLQAAVCAVPVLTGDHLLEGPDWRRPPTVPNLGDGWHLRSCLFSDVARNCRRL